MTYRRSSKVSYEVAGERAVILDAAGRELITLNPVGTLVWCELDGVRGADELVACLTGRFTGVTPEQLRADVSEFLRELDDLELVEQA